MIGPNPDFIQPIVDHNQFCAEVDKHQVAVQITLIPLYFNFSSYNS